MANQVIRDLGAGTLATDSALVLQNTSAATRPTQVAFSEMGGLVHSDDTITTANLTASVGTLHKVTIAGMTADRDFILPDTAAIGERVGVFVVDGDDTYVLQIKTAATSSEINGADASSTIWSSVFIQNEVVIFECIKAGGAGDTDWIVVQDGRIPCNSKMYLSTTTTGTPMTASTYVTLPLDTVENDLGDIADITNDYFDLRRAGNYVGTVSMQVDTPIVDTLYLTRIIANSVELSAGPKFQQGAFGDIIVNKYDISIADSDVGTASARIEGQGFCVSTSKDLIGSISRTYHQVREVF